MSPREPLDRPASRVEASGVVALGLGASGVEAPGGSPCLPYSAYFLHRHGHQHHHHHRRTWMKAEPENTMMGTVDWLRGRVWRMVGVVLVECGVGLGGVKLDGEVRVDIPHV